MSVYQPSSLTNPHSSRRSPQQSSYSYPSPPVSHYPPDYGKYNTTHVSPRHSSPGSSSQHQKMQYYPSHTIHGQPSYKQYVEQMFRNQHQIQPHQQYEHDVMSSGLGGCWKWSDTGEMVWCNSVSVFEDSWQRDKRYF